MTGDDYDDFIYAVKTTLEFYGKELEHKHMGFWFRALNDHPLQRIKAALDAHIQQGKYSPRPADILGIMGELKQRDAAHNPEHGYKTPEKLCPPDVAAAWKWFIARCVEGSSLDGLFENDSEIPSEEQERYLHVVNHEARAANLPDAIPEEYKLKEVWG